MIFHLKGTDKGVGASGARSGAAGRGSGLKCTLTNPTLETMAALRKTQ